MTKLIYSSKWDPIWGEVLIELEVASCLMLQSSGFSRKQVWWHSSRNINYWLWVSDCRLNISMYWAAEWWKWKGDVVVQWQLTGVYWMSFSHEISLISLNIEHALKSQSDTCGDTSLKVKHNVESTFKSLFLNRLFALFQDWSGLMCSMWHLPFDMLKQNSRQNST